MRTALCRTQEQICCGKTGYLLCGFDMKYLAVQGSDAQNKAQKNQTWV